MKPNSDRFQEPAQVRLLRHVRTLERLDAEKRAAAAALAEAMKDAEHDGFDAATLKVVLKLRRLTPSQRRERRRLEAVYMASLGMLDGDALPDSARESLDEDKDPGQPSGARSDATDDTTAGDDDDRSTAPPPAQGALELKEPDEARQEGAAAAAAGARIYDNPFPAGDPCRAAWDEGWCAERNSHGMDAPSAYQRRSEKPPAPPPPSAAPADASHDRPGAPQ